MDEEKLSYTDKKLAAFTTQAGILAFIVSIVYFLIDLQFKNTFEVYLAIGIALVSLVVVYVNQKGFHNSARIISIIGADVIISCAIFIEPFEVGTVMIFIVVFVGAIVGFGLKNTRITVFLMGFTILSIFVSTFYSPFEKEIFSPAYIKFMFRFNFFITSFLTSFLVYLAIRLNYLAESALKKSKLQIQKKNNELAKVNSELDSFVYSASHDLKSPISSLKGLVNITKLTHEPTEVKSYLDMMEGRLIHLDKFISDIANYSRNARQVFNLSKINLRDLIENYLKGLEFLPNAGSIQVKIDVHHDFRINSDTTRLEMVLGNIISNAFKYYDPAKKQSFVSISASVSGSNTIIEIQDNGIGIPSDYLNKIFDMFVRAHSQSTGAGLGLFIVKESLEKLLGSIEVTSEEGIGSKFKITLPNEYAPEVLETKNDTA